jgi:hypothetical protein
LHSVMSEMIITPLSSIAPAKPPLFAGRSISLCNSQTGVSTNNLPTCSFSPVTLLFINRVSLVIGDGRALGCCQIHISSPSLTSLVILL